MIKGLLAAGVAAVFMAGAPHANATTTLTCESPSGPKVFYWLGPALDKQCFAGNDGEGPLSVFGGTFNFSSKWDYETAEPPAVFVPTGPEDPIKITGVTFGTSFSGDPTGDNFGTWQLTRTGFFPAGSEAVIVLKQSQSYGAFLVDLADDFFTAVPGVADGVWATRGPGGSSNDLSHLSVYVNVIPTPLALPLIASAFGIAFAVRRFGKAKTA